MVGCIHFNENSIFSKKYWRKVYLKTFKTVPPDFRVQQENYLQGVIYVCEL